MNRLQRWLVGIGCLAGIALLLGLPVFPHLAATSQLRASAKVEFQSAPKKPSTKTVAAYTVPASDPKYIAIPAIGLGNTQVVALGLTAGGAIATPNSIYDTGWYNASSKPGDAGAMFIYGHIASYTNDAVFSNLNKLRPGDVISITRGDNTVFHYQVTGSQTYAYNAVNMAQVLSPVQAGDPGLNLMTCAGNVITVSGIKEFNERLVIFSRLT